MFVAAGLAAFLLVALPVAVCGLGLGGLSRQPWSDLLALRWDPSGARGLIGPLIGTLGVGLGAAMWAAPVGIGAATWLRWLAPAPVRRRGRQVVAALSAVPGVVVGFLCVVVLVPALGAVPGVSEGRALIVAVLGVGALALPAVVAGADRAMAQVPRRRLDAALALGATRVQALRLVVWPASAPGLVEAALLGVARALGDTMVVLLVVGAVGDGAGLGPVRTLTTTIARELSGSTGATERGALYALAAALVVLGIALGQIQGRFGVQRAR